jgi:hypothetical protein
MWALNNSHVHMYGRPACRQMAAKLPRKNFIADVLHGRPWTNADDDRLFSLRDELLLSNRKPAWAHIATHFKGSTFAACREHMRWFEGKVSPGLGTIRAYRPTDQVRL